MFKYFLIPCVIFLTACVSVPEQLELPENTNLVDFSTAQSPEASILEQKARWGGVIAAIKNNADTTMLEIVNFPLSSNLRPKKGDETLGRFRIYFNGLLDPVIYKAGRSVSVVGTISENEQDKIGEHVYNFPVLKDASVHLWKDVQRIEVTGFRQPYWMHNDPYFWGRSQLNKRPIYYRSTTKVKQSNSSNVKK